MWKVTLILLLLPLAAQASCTDKNDPAYDLAVSQGDYEKAFELVAREVQLNPAEKQRFKIIPGFSYTHDDRHGQADPESLELHLDPGLFIEGKEGACQGIAHERTHLRQFQRDHRRLHAYFSTHPVPGSGWKGCDREELSNPDASHAEEQAYTCLQDNDLVIHASAMDIEAVLSQVPYAANRVLRDEDLDYLVENLTRWSQNQTLITDHSNESYYLPEIKREDIRAFCEGMKEGWKRNAAMSEASEAWRYFCRVRR